MLWAGLAGQALELQQARRGWAQARGSPELANGGLRALGEARKANFTLHRNLSIYAVAGAWTRLGLPRSGLASACLGWLGLA